MKRRREMRNKYRIVESTYTKEGRCLYAVEKRVFFFFWIKDVEFSHVNDAREYIANKTQKVIRKLIE